MARFDAPDPSSNDIIGRADIALDEAKAAGRGRYHVAAESLPT